MRRYLFMAVPFLVSMAVAGSAQAVVIDMNALGSTSVPFNSSSQSGYYGVALLPGSNAALASNSVPVVTLGGSCNDPALAAGLTLQSSGICYHGGSVMHSNETFVLDWEPGSNWGTTTGYVEQFLSDVASGSGSLTSPYALTTQYTDSAGRAANRSIFGGGCIDGGASNDSSCAFGGSGPVHQYPSNGCAPSGDSVGFTTTSNTVCLTDAQIQNELSTMITQTGIPGHTQPNYSPVVVLLTPPGVETCLDSGGTVCSANSTSKVQFCSYHAQVNVGGTEVSYVVQPWTAFTGCDEPDIKPPPSDPTYQELETNVGERLVSPISQSMIAAIVNPGLSGWFSLGGSEINDNQGCEPLKSLDSVSVGPNSYFLQREYNNAASIVNDPATYFGCAPNVILTPSFVAPSAVNQGDELQFDGSPTASTLIVPNGNYQWDFGDGTTATGLSVIHTYGAAGNYTVKLSVTDRGGNATSFSQLVQILGSTGLPVPAVPIPTATTTSTSIPALSVRLQLLPQGLRSVLRSGIKLRVSSNEPANGFATIAISRRAARRAHIKTGKRPFVLVGTGTVSSVKDGTVTLNLRMSRAMAKKLASLKHVTLTVRLALVDSAGKHVAIDVAGNY